MIDHLQVTRLGASDKVKSATRLLSEDSCRVNVLEMEGGVTSQGEGWRCFRWEMELGCIITDVIGYRMEWLCVHLEVLARETRASHLGPARPGPEYLLCN